MYTTTRIYIYINVHHAPVMAVAHHRVNPGWSVWAWLYTLPVSFLFRFLSTISKQLGARAIHPSIHPAHHYTSAYSNTDLDDYHLMIPPSALLRWNIWKKRIYIVAAGGAEKQKKKNGWLLSSPFSSFFDGHPYLSWCPALRLISFFFFFLLSSIEQVHLFSQSKWGTVK